MTIKIKCGDALDVLKTLESESVDLLCTDPPYGISFMGKAWDKALPDIKVWKECLRVLKPGSFAFVMSIPRADCLSRMIISLEDAGFRVDFSPIYHAFASGFPKAQNIGKAVDKRNGRTQETYKPFSDYLKSQRQTKQLSMTQIDEKLGTNTAYSWWEGRLSGIQLPTKFYYLQLKEILELDNRYDELIERGEAEREVIGEKIDPDGKPRSKRYVNPCIETSGWNLLETRERLEKAKWITASATPQAKALDGSYGGFQPKPAVEVIIVAMKPLSEKTFVDQALKNGKGITWLDDCRVPYESEGDKEGARFGTQMDIRGGNLKTPIGVKATNVLSSPSGRFPANLIVSDDVLNDGRKIKAGSHQYRKAKSEKHGILSGLEGAGYYEGEISPNDSGSFSRYFDLDKWWAKTFLFLIVPKASKSEKNKGLDDMPKISMYKHDGSGNSLENYGSDKPRLNNPKGLIPQKRQNFHPTVKPLKLMAYLITLGSREGDTVLDPFMGTGTTILAAQNLNRQGIGIEIDEKYCEIAEKRCSQGVLDFNNEEER
ncbi:hypothetical protein LCGC14_1968430 [marine sediment metagenome]|uniref:Site-specific DNA-methyltransferase n=2 Tax=root TaxID=1 RepID=A0A7C1RKP5_UNCAE|nr:site-specific DNA-methyltransferase [Candidatus Aerophobetes bacterium]